jgi:hypothetical protein
MKQSKPPVLALRLMNAAGTDSSVIGDLVETYETYSEVETRTIRHTPIWFWKQAIAAAAPSPINALRWAAALPVAFYVANVVERSVTHWAQSMMTPLRFDATREVLARVDFYQDWRLHLLILISLFLSSALLVSSGTLIVPGRKRLVARCLLGVVGIVSARLLLRTTHVALFHHFQEPLFWNWVSIPIVFSGGLAAYRAVLRRDACAR